MGRNFFHANLKKEWEETHAMESIWQRTPYTFQLKATSHVISMRCKPNKPAATLLAQRAGAGKSSTYQTIGATGAGVALVIKTTLSLGSDQTTKIRNASSAFGSVNKCIVNF